MKRLAAALLILAAFTACNSIPPASEPAATNGSPSMGSATASLSAQATACGTEIPVPTMRPEPECDPNAPFCVVEGHFFLSRPIAPPGKVTIDPGYPYGSTEGGKLEPHHGVEFYNGSGTPVLAAADGVVVFEGSDEETIFAQSAGIYGNLVVLEHHFEEFQPAAVYTLYGHLSKSEVKKGQTVARGEEIGKVGSTGIAVGSHLHFEVRLGMDNYDSNRNPALWLQPLSMSSGTSLGVLAGRVEDGAGNALHMNGINIQYFPDPQGAQAFAWQVETYAPEEHPVQGDDVWHENFTLGDLQPGDYRISLMREGKLVEKWVKVEAGKLTFFTIKAQP